MIHNIVEPQGLGTKIPNRNNVMKLGCAGSLKSRLETHLVQSLPELRVRLSEEQTFIRFKKLIGQVSILVLHG